MATQLQLRRGTTSENASFTGAVGEVTVDTTKDTLIVQDGSTAGGHELAKADGTNITGVDSLENGGNTKVLATATGIDVTGDITLGDSNPTITLNDSSIANLKHTISSGSNKLQISTDPNGVHESSRIEFLVDNAESLQITDTGIDVTGTLEFTHAGTDLFATIKGPSARSLRFDLQDNASNDVFEFRNNAEESLLTIGSTGDISFYEDTGTTAKMVWSSSAESLTIPEWVIHDGNTSTKFGFGSANTINFISNGSDRLTIANSYTVFNEAGIDTDFRVESNDNTHMLFVDGGNNRVGIGTAPDAATVLHVQATEPQVLISDDSNPLQRFMAFDVGLAADEDIHFITVDQADGLAFGEKLNGNDRVIENEWVRITNTGSVGIGTDSPESKVHLRNTSGDTTLRIESGGVNGDRAGIRFQNSNDDSNHSGGIYCERESGILHSLTFETYGSGGTGTERMRITSDGEIRTSNAVIVGRLADRQAQAVGVTDATIVLAGNSSASGAGEEIGKVAFYNQDASGFGHNLAATIKALTNTSTGSKADLVFSTKQSSEGAEATESMRIDPAGNASFNTTSISPSANNVFGTALLQYGGASMSRTNSTTLDLNRSTSDGAIIQFRKDGATVGSIGSVSSDIAIGTGDTGLRFVDAVDAIAPCSTAGTQTDAQTDIGRSSFRFKDLYLSGGVYLGGTGAANKLDDYETGTWTPTDGSGAGLTFSTAVGTYTKVGNLVSVVYSVTYPSTVDTTDMAVGGLPFAPDVNFIYGGSQAYTNKTAAFGCTVTTVASKIIYRTGGTSSQINNNELSSGSIRGSLTYQV